MLSIYTIISWSLLVCSPENPLKANAECVTWMMDCLITEYKKTKDGDDSFEQCSESIPDYLLY